MGPFDVEVLVVCTPDDQGWCHQSLQPAFDREGVLVIERREEPLQIKRALLGTDERTQVLVDGLIRDTLWVFIRRPQGLRRAINRLVRQHRVERSTQTAGCRHRQERLEGFGWPIVVGVAVGKGESANALRIQRSKDLSDAAAAVVAHEIYL